MIVRHVMDTDTLTLLEAKHPVVEARFQVATGVVVAGVISFEEQVNGWLTYIRRAKRPDQVERGYARLAAAARFYGRLPVVGFPQPAIARFEALRRAVKNVGSNDLRIAAIALELGAIVVTRNAIDFGRVPGLVIEDWSV